MTNVFRSLYDSVFMMSNVNTLFTLNINIPLGDLMQANTHKINHHRNIY